MLSNRHDSTRIEGLITINDDPSYWMLICKTLQTDIWYDGSSFVEMSCSIRVESCQIINICYTVQFIIF